MLNFPDTPTLGQEFTAVGKSWVWDGVKWIVGHFGTAEDEILPVNGSTTLPVGFDGFVLVENTTGTPIMITLPPTPNPGQTILIKDTVGNATVYPITVNGGGMNIEGQATIVIMYNYGWLELFFTGIQWVQT